MFQRSDSPCFEDLYEYVDEENTEAKEHQNISESKLSSPQDFKCTAEELLQLDKMNKTDQMLAESIKKMNSELDNLRKAKRANNLAREKLSLCEDNELSKLLSNKLSDTTGHKIECQVDKYNQMEQITIHACDAIGLIKQIFSSFMQKMPTIVKKGTPYFVHDFSRVIVTFELAERQNLIQKLKFIERTEDIPRAIPEYER